MKTQKIAARGSQTGRKTSQDGAHRSRVGAGIGPECSQERPYRRKVAEKMRGDGLMEPRRSQGKPSWKENEPRWNPKGTELEPEWGHNVAKRGPEVAKMQRRCAEMGSHSPNVKRA